MKNSKKSITHKMLYKHLLSVRVKEMAKLTVLRVEVLVLKPHLSEVLKKKLSMEHLNELKTE